MEDRCIVCGEIIPEGKQVCYYCEKTYDNPRDCRSCLQFNWCADKGNHKYSGCLSHHIDKDEYFRVVMCGKCEHYNYSRNKCEISGIKMGKTDFCSKGVRRGM